MKKVGTTLAEWQRLIESIYYERDSARGVRGTFMWFVEEVGELSSAILEGGRENMKEEFADCLAWLSTLASLCEIELEEVTPKYASGCPGCGEAPCRCPDKIVEAPPA